MGCPSCVYNCQVSARYGRQSDRSPEAPSPMPRMVRLIMYRPRGFSGKSPRLSPRTFPSGGRCTNSMFVGNPASVRASCNAIERRSDALNLSLLTADRSTLLLAVFTWLVITSRRDQAVYTSYSLSSAGVSSEYSVGDTSATIESSAIVRDGCTRAQTAKERSSDRTQPPLSHPRLRDRDRSAPDICRSMHPTWPAAPSANASSVAGAPPTTRRPGTDAAGRISLPQHPAARRSEAN